MPANRRLKIEISKQSGFCFGVRRAVDLLQRALSDYKQVYCLGQFIHNSHEVKRLQKQGLKTLEALRNIRGKNVAIRTHGIAPEHIERLREACANVIDATCPYVRRAQKLAQELKGGGYNLIILGDKRHPEVKSLVGFACGRAEVISDPRELDLGLLQNKKLALISQTTQSKEKFLKIAGRLMKKDFKELRIFNTICSDTMRRQKEAIRLARKVDLMFIVGGKNSANTARLWEVCRRVRRNSFYIQGPDQIRKSWLKGVNRIGIATGASTPDWLVDKTVRRIMRLSP
jgi:4-hydroxy-3-methylbut-2-enyl diphosphate reductase